MEREVGVTLLGEKGKPTEITDAKWKSMEQRAVGIIRLCLADSVVHVIGDETTAKGAMRRLEERYMKKSPINQVHLRRKLFRLQMEDDGDLMAHLNEFHGIIHELAKVEVTHTDNDLA